jgi:hypothetical protein
VEVTRPAFTSFRSLALAHRRAQERLDTRDWAVWDLEHEGGGRLSPKKFDQAINESFGKKKVGVNVEEADSLKTGDRVLGRFASKHMEVHVVTGHEIKDGEAHLVLQNEAGQRALHKTSGNVHVNKVVHGGPEVRTVPTSGLSVGHKILMPGHGLYGVTKVTRKSVAMKNLATGEKGYLAHATTPNVQVFG